MIRVIKLSFVSVPISIVVGIKSIPQIPRGTKFVNLHKDMLWEVNIIFAGQPSNQGGGGLDPLRPLGPPRYFGLLMVHPNKPPFPPNKPYHQPLNYLKYVNDFDPSFHVRIFKVAIRANNEIDDAKIVNLFNSTFIDIVFGWCNNYLGDYPNCVFVEMQLFFVKGIEKFIMMNKFTYN